MSDVSTSNPLQFHLRHLLAATVVIAIASALLAPWVRDFSRGQWLRLGLTVFLALAGFGAMLLLHVNLYFRRRRSLGAIRWDLRGTWRGQTAWRCLMPYVPLALAAIMAIALAWIESIRRAQSPFDAFGLVYSLNIGMMLASGVFLLRCPMDRALLGENGVFVSAYFFPWDDLGFSWEKGAKPTSIALTTATMAKYDLEVPPHLEESVALFLESRARLRENRRRPKQA
jgi:hypothetical protein